MSKSSDPRGRLLATARDLFYQEGIHTVGVDRLVKEAGVTRATFYRHFPTKEDLVVAYLRATDEELRDAVDSRAADGAAERAVLAVLDLVGETVGGDRFRGCHFINASAEYPNPAHPVRLAVAEHREWFVRRLCELAAAAGHPDPAYAASVLVLLHDGALAGGGLDEPGGVRATLHRAVRELLGGRGPGRGGR